MIKVNEDELKQKIAKLKEKAKAAIEKAGGKYSDPHVRLMRKKVKRAQRRLRAVRAYKTSSTKKTDAGQGEGTATA